MVKYYLTRNGSLEIIEKPEVNCWINMINPTEGELLEVENTYKIEADDLRAALDEEEAARITYEDNYICIVIDIPAIEKKNGKNRFITIPMGMIITKEVLITVCLRETDALNLPIKIIRTTDTKFKNRMVLTILLEDAKLFLKYLRQINKQSEQLELVLHESIENSALLEMMEIGRSLLYFSTSLKANNVVLDKISRSSAFKKYEEDMDLLEDVIIETKQALEMADTYSGVINGTMDAYASVIGNNMNMVQKFLATASIIIAVPSLIFDMFGMNVISEEMSFVHFKYSLLIIVVIAIISTIMVGDYFKHKKMY